MNENLNVFIKKTMLDFENNIHYKNDLKYIKLKFVEIYKEYNKHINELNKQIIKLKSKENLDTLIDIKCPYCKNKIWINKDVNVNQITCPKCFGLIEIGWKNSLN